jgi:hypothetical protein
MINPDFSILLMDTLTVAAEMSSIFARALSVIPSFPKSAKTISCWPEKSP